MKSKETNEMILSLMNSLNDLSDFLKKYKDNVDTWMREINLRISKLKGLSDEVTDNKDNIQHNYELIFELKDQIDDLKQETRALKMIQIISLKNQKGK